MECHASCWNQTTTIIYFCSSDIRCDMLPDHALGDLLPGSLNPYRNYSNPNRVFDKTRQFYIYLLQVLLLTHQLYDRFPKFGPWASWVWILLFPPMSWVICAFLFSDTYCYIPGCSATSFLFLLFLLDAKRVSCQHSHCSVLTVSEALKHHILTSRLMQSNS